MPAKGAISRHRIGMRTLTSGLLLASALAGLVMIDSQIQVFSLDQSAGPDAKTVPMVALVLLAAALVLRMVLSFRQPDTPFGSRRDLLGLLAICAATAISLLLMPRLGFIACASFAGAVTALAFGERKIIFWAVLPIALAAFIGILARLALNIPLP